MSRRGMRPRISTRGAAALAVLVLGLGACGGDDTTSEDGGAATGAADAAAEAGAGAGGAPGCDLVSPEEVEAATGLTVLGSEDLSGGCRWLVEQVDEDVLESAIGYQPFDGAQLDQQRSAGDAGMDVTELSGIGDEAIAVTGGRGDHPLGEVWVRVGDTSFRVVNQFATGRYAGAIEKQTALAEVVAEAMG